MNDTMCNISTNIFVIIQLGHFGKHGLRPVLSNKITEVQKNDNFGDILANLTLIFKWQLLNLEQHYV